ncbi:polycystin-1-like protein 2 [Amia ocellicauda]|uniref:polycystin-1-like protein 2 n=1 Tax=Amia ocellicauda TaxID=2972642 RepID=UPI003463CD60
MPIKTQGCEAWCVSRGVALDGQEAPACPDFQKGFDGSCYEFVGLQRSFLSAQGWCERGGGHLAFVLNDETQQFLQKHLAPNQDWWIGLAPASQNLTLQIPGAEGPLSWLDGSDVSFSNWHKEPQTGPHCGHILRDSGFQWEATNNCTEEFHFVCQFELDRTLACVDHNATLQCGSGQVIEIDDSFYGRKTLHYCQLLTPPSASPPQEECSWVDVVELVSGHCHGLQVCQAAADMASFGEPCPGFGSYLSVEYHCKEGLKLEVVDPAAVFENVTIGIKWLLKPFSGNLTCTLGTGDGHTIDPYSPVSLESSVIHSYTRPGIYTVTVECTTSEWYVTAQKAITIQEPIGDFGIVRCYSMNHSGESGNCRALYGSTLQIQVELDAGTNITYKVQTGSDLLATLTAMRGINPHNITIDSMAKQQLGPGSHRLTILASNAVSASEVSMALDVLFVEPILGLQASVVSEGALSMGSDIQVSVSVSHGAPLQLHFKITGANESFSETRQMDVSKLQVFNLPVRFQGTLLVTVRATNGFSQMDVEAGNVTVISNIPETNTNTTDSDEEKDSSTKKEQRDLGEDMFLPASKTRAVRNGQDFQIKESHNMPVETDSKVTLEAVNFGSDGDYTFKWSCVDGCWPQMKSCQDALDNSRKQLEITPECLPDPYTIVAVNVTARNTGNTNPQTAVSCIAVTAAKHLTLDIKCTENCGPVDKSKAVRLTLSCSTCPKIRWYFEDQNNTDWVRNATTGISVNGLHSLLSQQVSSLQQEANLGTMLAHMYQSVLTEMNINSDVQEKSQRVEMRQQMINNLTSAFQISSAKSIEDIQQAAGAIMAITDRSDELTPTAVIQAFDFIEDLSQSLLFYNVSESHVQRGSAIERIVKAASSVLEASDMSGVQYQISGHVVRTVDNVQSALLAGRQLNQKASTLSTPQISLYVNRVSPDQIHGQVFNVKNASSAHFTLPLATASALPTNESIDVRMVSLGMNPYSWSEGESISGIVGGLSLTRENGSTIPVSNLTAEIEILLPRPKAGVVNSTILHLSNYSTIMVNMTVTNISLVLKLEPSEDIPMQLLLGFLYHPNDTHNDAETQLPHSGSTMEEKYTWVLGPNDLPQEIGVYYLLVRPIVKAGVNSTNATVSVTSITTQCVHWDEVKSNWSTQGCRVGPLTTPQVTQCLCTHLTFFGSSFFVMPNVVDISRTTELFATFADNPVVVCFVGAIFVVYILFVIWARRKDIKDAAKVKITVLEDNDPLAQYRYMLTVCTGHRRGAATSSQVTVTLLGSEGQSEPHHLTDSDKPVFERGGTDMFLLTTPFSLGELQSIRLWHDNSGDYPAWYINKVIVHDLETDQKWHFLCSCWLAIDVGDCVLDKVFPVATEMDLKKFSNLFFMKTANDFGDGHIWYSVLSRPPRSNFTCVQRVSCCLSLLLCTMLTSIMFWGIPKDPSEQKMDLGKIEFTWQQVMIGIQSSVIMFPINLLIVSIFRNTCPREKKSEQPSKQAKPEPAKQGKSGRVTPSQPPSPQSVHRDITPDSVIKDIKRIAQSLSKVMKSPVPQLEKDFGRTTDINKLLSMVEEIIRLQNRAGGDFYTETRKKEGSLVLTLGAVNLQESTPSGSPERTSIDGQKRSNYSLYLYRQLQHVEKELQLLGPTRFKPPQSYRQAMQQVQGMKGLLESHLSEQDRQGLSGSPSPAENSTRKKCCQNGLPWWFVFIGWFLVVATSGMSGFYTMLYGLKYGKDRSVSWLISMTVSFFESLFITQPLKVLGFAAFFALVLKKVDVDEGSEVAIEGTLSNPGDPGAVLSTRRDSTCSFYQPPPPTDIERMRNNMIKEQKVFALIREILAYIGFLWMLLLVAYGQRDPHAFFLTQHIEKSFTSGTSDSMSHQDVFTWVNTTVLSNLFGQYPGFITDGNSKLVGSARMRQVRVRRDSCPVAKSMRGSIPDCHAPYSWDLEDMGLYGPGWNTSTLANNSQAPKAWQYQSQGTLRAHPIWGSVALYRGGGYVADLGPDLQSATSVLQYLFDNTWLDVYTRAVFVEFTVYNANINLFCIVTLSMETTAVGAFQLRSELQSVRLYQSSSGMNVFVMASEVIYFLFILYYMFVQGKRIKEQKWAYFHSKCNLLELAIITLSWSALSVFIKRTLLGNQDVEYYQLHRDQFVSFYETAAADAVLGYLIAFLVLLATVKLWHLLRLNPKLHMITSTLQRAWTDISGFIIVMIIMFLSYSIAFNLIFGWKLYSYRTLLEAAQTIVSLQLGIFNYDEVLDFNPVLGAFLVGSCIIFMTFVVLNLFISVILVAFSEEQKTHKPSEEEEIVDLMLMKICSFFGIRSKKDEKEGENGAKGSSSKTPTRTAGLSAS